MKIDFSGFVANLMREYWKFFTSTSINKNRKMFEVLWNEIVQLRTNYPILSPALVIFIGLQVYYRIVVVKPSKLHCKQNSFYHVSDVYVINVFPHQHLF